MTTKQTLCEASSQGEAIQASPTVKKAKPKAFQPKRAKFQLHRVFVLDQLGPANIDLRDYLSNKRKLHSKDTIHVSPSQCEQAGCQLVTMHSVHCCLGLFPIASPPTQQLVFNRLSIQIFKRSKSQRKKAIKVSHLTAASVNMISRGRDLLQSQRRKWEVHTSSVSSPHFDYSPGLGQILVEQEGAF